jgi:ATP-dependent 26S proteasome regulatory subunit
MTELARLNDADLIAATRDMESEIRRAKQNITRITQEIKQYDARVKENQEKLKLSTQLPHMVANVGEILDVEDEDDEGREGSGFTVKKTDG